MDKINGADYRPGQWIQPPALDEEATQMASSERLTE